MLVFVQAGFVSLNDLNFKASAAHFRASDIDPRELLLVFPDLCHTGQAQAQAQASGSGSGSGPGSGLRRQEPGISRSPQD